jgi:hypothetical protein
MSFKSLTNDDLLWMRIFKDGKGTIHGPFINNKRGIDLCIKAIEDGQILAAEILQTHRDRLEQGLPIAMNLGSTTYLGAALQSVIEHRPDVAAKIRAEGSWSDNVYPVCIPTMHLDDSPETASLESYLRGIQSMSRVPFKIESFSDKRKAYDRAEEFSESFATQYGFLYVDIDNKDSGQGEDWPNQGKMAYKLGDVIAGTILKIGDQDVKDFVVVHRVYCKLADASEFVPKAS